MEDQNEKNSHAANSHEGGLLKTTAAALGGAAGKLASLAKPLLHREQTPGSTTTPAKTASGKLPKKNKSRLPRRQKKEQQKAAQARAQA